MRIILSRKGFDSKFGGQASPILPDKSLLSLPIPEDGNPHHFSDIRYGARTLDGIISELKPRRKAPLGTCHLDPDLRKESLPTREKGWKGLFGQSSGAQTHLRNQGVQEDDLFLFFGWFRHTEYVQDKDHRFLQYGKPVQELHVIFGYLQIGAIVDQPNQLQKWMEYHPHAQPNYLTQHKNNTIYVARDHLTFAPELRGYGTLRFHPELQLTRQNCSRSKWQVPAFFKDLQISHHTANSQKKDYFQSASIGQEFVIQPDKRAENWAKSLILKHADT